MSFPICLGSMSAPPLLGGCWSVGSEGRPGHASCWHGLRLLHPLMPAALASSSRPEETVCPDLPCGSWSTESRLAPSPPNPKPEPPSPKSVPSSIFKSLPHPRQPAQRHTPCSRLAGNPPSLLSNSVLSSSHSPRPTSCLHPIAALAGAGMRREPAQTCSGPTCPFPSHSLPSTNVGSFPQRCSQPPPQRPPPPGTQAPGPL